MTASECPICRDPLDAGLTITRCGHVFHTSCILSWFQLKPLCPLCKTERTGSFERELRDAECPLDPGVLDAVEQRLARGETPPDAAACARSIRATLLLVAAAQRRADAAQQAKARELSKVIELRAEDERLAGRVSVKEKDAAAAVRQLQELGLSSLAWAADEPGGQSHPDSAGAVSGSAPGAMSREMLTNLGQQVGWRSSELRQLRAKVRKAQAQLEQPRAANADLHLGASSAGKGEKRGGSGRSACAGASGAVPGTARAPAPVGVAGLGRMGDRPSL
jgi:hypothetical protein